ncbi:putative maltokinase [Paraburkholderia strydomiana]|uniref:putative maltokinase n=1 Tax=Paraburkholderia strydomiana TaxID=1245417 RepID=UPI001BE82D35|nr:putative maltokinase [Paraburkholderia strydomiana]MBT2794288.1 putative maltokinase [Paraburkholderia strydomiana]
MDDGEDLRVRAYYVWEAAGRPEGRAGEHWAQARQESGLDAAEAPVELAANHLASIFEPDNIALLECRILPQYLLQRRWFAAKDRSIESLRMVTPVVPIADVGVLAQVEVSIEGSIERYALPLAVVWNSDDAGDEESELARDMAIAAVRGEGRTGLLTDAFFVRAFIKGLLATASDGKNVASSEDGTLDIRLESGAEDAIGACADADADLRWLSTEQSNSSVIVGRRIVMKLMRRLQSGVHPEAEMCRFLTRVGYGNASPLLAEIVQLDRDDGDGGQRSLLVLEGFVCNEGDAWSYATGCLRKALTQSGAAVSAEFEQLAGIVGRRLGELHTALSKGEGGVAFAPEAVQARDIDEWKDAAVVQLEQAVDALERQRDSSSLSDHPLVRRIAENRKHIVSAIRNATLAASNAAKTRIHGDFHLGQVLCAKDDVYIIDFEGEPAKPIDSRRAKSSVLRDVAGLLRSISYATAFAAKQHDASSAKTEARGDAPSEARLEASRQAAERNFLNAYVQAANADPLATGDSDTVSLLNLFLVEKAAYEVCYEAANRPEWIGISLQGLARALAAFPGLDRRLGASTQPE